VRLELLDYKYPEDLVAQRPLSNRSDSRMLVAERAGSAMEHSRVNMLPRHLRRGDLLVLNDSRVAAARLFGRRSCGEQIELLVVEPVDGSSGLWRCLLKRARKLRCGERLIFGMQSFAVVSGREGIYLLVLFEGNSLKLAMENHGVPPLPPYIKREGFSAYTFEDRERYQTVYARHSGSAAAPTAGLHFSNELLEELKAAGIEIACVTLHVGIDTFRPMRCEQASEHRMHGERVSISKEAALAINRARGESRRIVAVGTTAARALESSIEDNETRSGDWVTELFILPGYRFRAIDALLTNFHQPRSTLLAMVCAFAGREFLLSCYQEAIRERYRLFSYGDCMFIK